MNIKRDEVQTPLDLEPGLTDRFSSVKEAVAAGIYQRGIKRMAGQLYVAPGNLSVQLSGDGQRHFDLDLLERYIEVSGDLTPIHYLVAKYCGEPAAVRDAALDRLQTLLTDLPALLASAGVNKRRAR